MTPTLNVKPKNLSHIEHLASELYESAQDIEVSLRLALPYD